MCPVFAQGEEKKKTTLNQKLCLKGGALRSRGKKRGAPSYETGRKRKREKPWVVTEKKKGIHAAVRGEKKKEDGKGEKQSTISLPGRMKRKGGKRHHSSQTTEIWGRRGEKRKEKVVCKGSGPNEKGGGGRKNFMYRKERKKKRRQAPREKSTRRQGRKKFW